MFIKKKDIKVVMYIMYMLIKRLNGITIIIIKLLFQSFSETVYNYKIRFVNSLSTFNIICVKKD